VKSLTEYWNKTLQILALNLLFLPVEREILVSAQHERASSGLLTNDSVVVGAMRVYGVPALATSDLDFERVTGITVYSPTDVAA
jgi:predicted nucleic acid-binding protein